MKMIVLLVLFVLAMALWGLGLLGVLQVATGWIAFFAVLLLAAMVLYVGRNEMQKP